MSDGRKSISVATRARKMGEDDLRLGRLLVQSGHLREEVLRAVLSEQQRLTQTGATAPKLGQMLVDRGIVGKATVQAALDQQAKTTLVCVSCRLRVTTSKLVSASVRCPKCGGALKKDDVSVGAPTVKAQAIPTVQGLSASGATRPIAAGGRQNVSPSTIQKAIADPDRRLGKVVLLDELGRGGMGIVYRAWEPDLQRVVAAKVAADSDDKMLSARFLREARIASKLRHPNIVAVHELAEANGRPFFTMDYIQGGSLEGWIAKKQPMRRVLEMVRTIALALHFAHEQGVVHRDIKPQNVLVTEDGTPYLTDFGLARHILSQSNLTHTQGVVGTPRYMSPEQAQGMNEAVDARTDVYSLGAVLYEGLTGVPPVETQEIFGMVDAIVNDPPIPPAQRAKGIPPDVDTICLKCLEKAPAGRYQTAKDLADDIDRFLRGEPILARPVGSLVRSWRAVRRRWLPISASAALVVVLVVGLIAWHYRKRAKSPTEIAWGELKARVVEMYKSQDFGRAKSELDAFQPDSSAMRAEVEDRKKEVRDAATRAYQAIVDQTPDLIKAGKFLDLKKLLDGVARWEVQELTDAADQEMQKDAQAAYAQVEDRVATLLKSGLFDDAKKALTEVQRWNLQAWTDRTREGQKEVDRQEGEMKQVTLSWAFADLQWEVIDLCLPHTLGNDHDFIDVKKLRDDKMGRLVPQLATEMKVLGQQVDSAEHFWFAVEGGARKMKGRTILFDKERNQSGVVTGSNNKEVTLQVDGGKLVNVGFQLLPPDTLLDIAREGKASPESVGLWWLCNAEDLARKAHDIPLKRDRSREDRENKLLESRANALKQARTSWAQSSQQKALDALADSVEADVPDVKGLTVNDKFATRGGRLYWDYHFTQGNPLDRPLLLDWGFSPREVEKATEASGVKFGDECIRLQNGEVRFCMNLDGDAMFRARVYKPLEIPQTYTVFGVSLGGYTCYLRDKDGGMSLLTPRGVPVFSGPADPLASGKYRLEIELAISNGKIWVKLNSHLKFFMDLPEPSTPAAPAVFATRDTILLVEELQVWGTPEAQSLKALGRDLGFLSDVGSKLLRPRISLTDGKDVGKFEKSGSWSVAEDDKQKSWLTGEAQEGSPATLTYKKGLSDLQFTMRFQNAGDGPMEAEVTVWTGHPETSATFMLPGFNIGRSRGAVITSAGSTTRCVVDNHILTLPEAGSVNEKDPPFIRITVRRGKLQLGPMELQAVRVK